MSFGVSELQDEINRIIGSDKSYYAKTLGGSKKSFYDTKTPIGTRRNNIDDAATKAKQEIRKANTLIEVIGQLKNFMK